MIMTKEDVIKEFTKIKGVNKDKAELLYEKGFDSVNKLKKSDVKDLVKIEGIDDALAKKIKDQLMEKKETKTKAASSKKIEKIETKKETLDKTKSKKKTSKKPELKPEEKEEKKTIKKPGSKKEKLEEEKIEATEKESEEKYKVKIKPKLSKETKERLVVRKKIKNRTPEFLREEWFRYKRIPKNWRRPDGNTSKMRLHHNYRPSVVRVGFRGPKEVRGLHPSGFQEIMVYNANDLNDIDPKTQAARIGGSVGTKKRLVIEKKAEELNIRILNI